MTEIVLHTLTIAAIYGLVTLSLNLQYGLTGLLNFGQSLFFAIGAYAVAAAHFHEMPLWIGIIAGPILGALAGVAAAIPARRLGEHYWALMTLAMAELFLAVMRSEGGIAGGGMGTRGIPKLESVVALPILIAVTLVVLVAFERIRRSQFGRVIRTAREDPVLVAATGRDVFRYQAIVMAIGGAVAAGAGVIFAFWFTFVAPEVFALTETLIVWAMLILGGRGNNYGAILGALLLQAVFVGSRFLPDAGLLSGEGLAIFRTVLVGLIIVVVLVVRPEGILPERKVRMAGPREPDGPLRVQSPLQAEGPVSSE